MCWWLPMSGAGARVGRGQVTQLCHAGGNTARDWVEAFRRGIRRLRYDIPCTHLCWTWKVTVNTHTTLPCLIYQLLHCIVDCADIPPSTRLALLRSDVVAWRGWGGAGVARHCQSTQVAVGTLCTPPGTSGGTVVLSSNLEEHSSSFFTIRSVKHVTLCNLYTFGLLTFDRYKLAEVFPVDLI